MTGLLDRGDRLAGELERDGHVMQKRARGRVGDQCALVADDRLGPGEVGAHRLEHASGDDDHVRAARPGSSERRARARPQHVVLRDQRPVEVARHRRDLGGEAGGELQDCVVRNLTRSLICASVSLPLYGGMTPFGKPGTT